MLPKLLAPGATQELVERARALMLLLTPPQGVADAQRGMARRADQSDLLPRISCPTAVLSGADDALIPPAEAKSLAAAIPGAELTLIAGAGHLSNLEKPAEFSAALARWLSRIPAA
jgi:pimeloyl-ACP methyl ester carboxylesterase